MVWTVSRRGVLRMQRLVQHGNRMASSTPKLANDRLDLFELRPAERARMIHRLQLPVDLDGDEIGSLVKMEKGTTLSCVDVSETSPVTWGIVLADMLRQAARSFERRGLTVNGRLAARVEQVSAYLQKGMISNS